MPLKKRSKRKPRKKNIERTNEVNEQIPLAPTPPKPTLTEKEAHRAELKAKLRAKMYASKLSRSNRVARDNRAEKLEEMMETVSDELKRQKIQQELDLIDKADDRDENNFVDPDFSAHDL